MFNKSVFISAELSTLSDSKNEARTKILRNLLEEFSFQFKEVDGCYKEVEEKSFCVHSDFRQSDARLLKKLARVFDQESILIVNNGDASLYYLQSQKTEEIGFLTNVNPKRIEELEAYSIIDNKLYTIL